MKFLPSLFIAVGSQVRRLQGDDSTLQWISKIKTSCSSCEAMAENIALLTGTVGTTSALEGVNDCYVEFEGGAQAARAVRRLRCVDLVEPNTVVANYATPPWGLDRIDQEDLPLDNTQFSTRFTGAGQVVYIIDTGIFPEHREFSGRARIGGDFIDEKPDTDTNGHGTHVSGTSIGNTVGVARKAQAYGVKVLAKNGRGTVAGVIRGVQWAVKHADRKTSVLSLSLGGARSTALNNAVESASEAGHAVVVAAGNANSNACDFSPASAGGRAARSGSVITVASTTNADFLSGFSNFGNCVDILAPGSGVLSAWPTSKNAYRTLSGTSMSTPHVSGVLLTLLEKHNGDKAKAIEELFAIAARAKVRDLQKKTPNLLLQTSRDGEPTERCAPCDAITRRRNCRRVPYCYWRLNPATDKKECIARFYTQFPTPSP